MSLLRSAFLRWTCLLALLLGVTLVLQGCTEDHDKKEDEGTTLAELQKAEEETLNRKRDQNKWMDDPFYHPHPLNESYATTPLEDAVSPRVVAGAQSRKYKPDHSLDEQREIERSLASGFPRKYKASHDQFVQEEEKRQKKAQKRAEKHESAKHQASKEDKDEATGNTSSKNKSDDEAASENKSMAAEKNAADETRSLVDSAVEPPDGASTGSAESNGKSGSSADDGSEEESISPVSSADDGSEEESISPVSSAGDGSEEESMSPVSSADDGSKEESISPSLATLLGTLAPVPNATPAIAKLKPSGPAMAVGGEYHAPIPAMKGPAITEIDGEKKFGAAGGRGHSSSPTEKEQADAPPPGSSPSDEHLTPQEAMAETTPGAEAVTVSGDGTPEAESEAATDSGNATSGAEAASEEADDDDGGEDGDPARSASDLFGGGPTHDALEDEALLQQGAAKKAVTGKGAGELEASAKPSVTGTDSATQVQEAVEKDNMIGSRKMGNRFYDLAVGDSH